MISKSVNPEVSAYVAGAIAGAIAMLLALLPHLHAGPPATADRMSPAHVETLRSSVPGQSLYSAAKTGLPPAY
jgi:hypothetical protein